MEAEGMHSCYLMGIEFPFCKMRVFCRLVTEQRGYTLLYSTVLVKMAKM